MSTEGQPAGGPAPPALARPPPPAGSRSLRRRAALGGAVGLVLLGAAALRLGFLADYLGYDECQHYLVAQSPLGPDFVREFRLRTHPPLTYLAMKPFLALGSQAWAVKLLSLTSGVAAVLLAYGALRQRLPGGGAFLGAAVIGTLPGFVLQSVEVRQYSLGLVFVWLSLLVYLRASRPEDGGEAPHWLLALTFFLALITEYMAAPHVAALGTVALAPAAGRLARRGAWGALAGRTVPYVVALGLVGALFAWQFRGGIPSRYSHTAPFMYGGSLADPGAVWAFLARSTRTFADGLLPDSLGLGLLAFLLVPWSGLLPEGPGRRTARALSLAAILALLLQAGAALLGHLPLGGRPRHNVMVIPIIILADALILAELVGRLPRPAWRIALALVAAGAVMSASIQRLEAARGPLGRRAELSTQAQVAEYGRRPGAIVTDWRGRSLATWWLLPGRSPRLVQTEADGCERFDYRGTLVVQCGWIPEADEKAVRRVVELARADGRAWLLLSELPGRLGRPARVRETLAAYPDVTVRWSGPMDGPVLLNSMVAEVERR